MNPFTRVAVVVALTIGSIAVTTAPASATFGHHSGGTPTTCESSGDGWHTIAVFKRSWLGGWTRQHGGTGESLSGTAKLADFTSALGVTHAVVKTGTRSAIVDLLGEVFDGTISSNVLRSRWSWHPTMDTVHLCDDSTDPEVPPTTVAPPTTAPPVAATCSSVADASGLVAKFNVVGGQYVFEKPAGNGGVVTLSSTTLDGGNWVSTVPIGSVLVKGGTAVKVDAVTPAATGGAFSNAGLVNDGGQVPDISHIEFYCAGSTPVPPTTAPPATAPPTTAPPTTAPPTTAPPAHHGCSGGWSWGSWTFSWRR